MAIDERDPHTGYTTTGHEWNGITELNRPVPRVIWFFLAATVVFSVIYWILMPAWPLVDTYTKGILGADQRARLASNLEAAAMARSEWSRQIEALQFSEIQSDEGLMRSVRNTGKTLFEDNCGVCHGMKAEGGSGYPRLTDDAWLWGGDSDAVAETLRVGINSTHDETRFAQMQAFGRDGILDREAIGNVVDYVLSLSKPGTAGSNGADSVAAGAEVFAENCVACHGEDGSGNIELGAPDLTDDFWIYDGDRFSIYKTVYGGRQGHMPHWEGRLSALERKILTLYVLDLGARGQ